MAAERCAMLNGIKLVIFDMDGVMYDTERLAIQAWQAAGTKHGYTIREETVIEMIGLTAEDTEAIMRRDMGSSFPYGLVKEERLRIGRAQIEEHAVGVKDGLFEALERFGAMGLKLAVATSTDRPRTERLFERTGTPPVFAAVVCGEDVARRKPAPDIFLEAARRAECDSHECLVIEDSDVGILAAHRAGMRVVFVRDIKPLSDEAGRHVLARFDGLRALLTAAGTG
ncbi:MAG: HAD-IA family hydrolase [Chitinivibrionales bacterium]|nr:HAD-IA family hydrolase [Chitinivibrionales bacterium]